MDLLTKLEEIKSIGAYSVNLMFGEDVGADDSGIPAMERNTRLLFYPVGCLGQTRVMWIGRMKYFLAFDFKSLPKQISNPPKREEYESGGYFIWGTQDSVNHILSRGLKVPPQQGAG